MFADLETVLEFDVECGHVARRARLRMGQDALLVRWRTGRFWRVRPLPRRAYMDKNDDDDTRLHAYDIRPRHSR